MWNSSAVGRGVQICVALLLLQAGLSGFLAWDGYGRRLDAAARRLTTEARTLSEHFNVLLKVVDVHTDELVLTNNTAAGWFMDRNGRDLDLTTLPHEMSDYIGTFIVLDAAGAVLARSTDLREGDNAPATWDVTARLLAGQGRGYVRGKTVRFTASGERLIFIGRRIEAADGSLIGVVLAGLSLDRLEQFYSGLGTERVSRALVADDDTALLVAGAFLAGSVGAQAQTAFPYSLPEPGGAAARDGRTSDANPAYIATAAVPNSPFRTVAVMSEDVIFGEWRQDIGMLVFIWIAGGAAIAVAVMVMVRGQIRIEHALKEVEAKSRELAESNRRYADQSEELEAVNAELENFAYVASHDLKSPLRGIDNLATWIEEDLGESIEVGVRKNLDLLRGRIRRMETLLDDMLMYSRAGRVFGEVKTVDVGELVRSIVDLNAPRAGFTVETPSAMPVFETAETPLSQVLTNLINNAVKHHDRSAGRVVVEGADEAGDFYRFSITDDGPGIEERFHERVFLMFQSLKPRDLVEGSGMGLAIVKKVVESAGGNIKLVSPVRDQRGTSFYFTWPKKWTISEAEASA